MAKNNSVTLTSQKKEPSVELRGYEWKVIADPTRDSDDPGVFFGRLFRMIDIRLNRDEKSTWPDGITFEHITTGCRLSYKDGLLVDLSNSKIIQKKPRIRNRSKRAKTASSNHENKLLTANPVPYPTCPRRFVLLRREDPNGVSGTGQVAEGTVFTSGLTVLHWLREPYALGVYQTVDDLISVHGHEGRTQLQYIDPGETL